MARDASDTTPITSRDELIAWFEKGLKRREDYRIGTEHEKIAFRRKDLSPVPYNGQKNGGEGGIRALLERMRAITGWQSIMEGSTIIGLADEGGGGAISLEPGGQFELSGAPVRTVHQTYGELEAHMAAAKRAADPLDIGFLALGMSPKWRLDETPVMPKGRYKIMASYMPKVGVRGLDMMFRTATVQVNLDFCSESDMVKKLRVGLALQPVVTALFANSPFTEGKPNGFLSARSEIWRHTDNARAGMLHFVFEPGMSFERYVDYALDVPMYFVKRGSMYHDVAGASFRHLLTGSLNSLPGERATISDWANHLSTIFPEVRLKTFLEMRGADAGPLPHLCALPALFTGLLYDEASLDTAWRMVKGWSADERQKLRDEAPRLGLSAKIAGRSVRDVARDVLALSRSGLIRRRHLDEGGRDEAQYLEPIEAIVHEGRTAAERLLEKYYRPRADGGWGGNVDHAFTECVY